MTVNKPTHGQSGWDVTLNAALDTLDAANTAEESAATTLAGTVSTLSGTVSGHTTTLGTHTTQIGALQTTVGALTSVRTINAQTGTTYTLVAADVNKLITMSNNGAQTLTVPTNASVAIAVGSAVDIVGIGTGVVTIGNQGGVTLSSSTGSTQLRTQNSVVTLTKIATDTWLVSGDLA